jgi:adenosylcobinamide-phosphate synthase
LLRSALRCCFFLTFLPKPLLFFGTAFLLYTSIAARDLLDHAVAVHAALDESIEAARQQVSLLVGRDTSQMDEAAIIRACVESVAENMSDGIIAPLVWATAGAVLALPATGIQPAACAVLAAMLYKAISTMDSMFGYKNERYQHFGCCPATLDDAANFFPARISGLAIVAAAPFYSGNLKQSWRILRRDCRNHASPNSGWPEAAAAGALGIQLGGEAVYFGKTVSKPLLGESLAPPLRQHILRACHVILTASFFCLLLFCSLFALLLLAF